LGLIILQCNIAVATMAASDNLACKASPPHWGHVGTLQINLRQLGELVSEFINVVGIG
jgi:hypothetical protein